MNKKTEKPPQPPKEQQTTLKAMGEQKNPPFRLKKLLTEREITLEEMPNELRVYVLKHPEVKKVFSQPLFKENDSSTLCFKLEIKSHIKGFNSFEFWHRISCP